jgi:hypothetical protein
MRKRKLIKNDKKPQKEKKEPKKKHQNSNHKYLQITNLLLIISFFYFLFNTTPNKNQKIEFMLASLLIATIIFSQLFWDNPVKNSKIHKIDAIIAKIVIFSYILYTLVYKFVFSYLLVLSAIAISFYYSNHFSTQQWCSNKHLFCHGCLHIFCFIATFYAFFPPFKKVEPNMIPFIKI